MKLWIYEVNYFFFWMYEMNDEKVEKETWNHDVDDVYDVYDVYDDVYERNGIYFWNDFPFLLLVLWEDDNLSYDQHK